MRTCDISAIVDAALVHDATFRHSNLVSEVIVVEFLLFVITIT